MSLSRGELLSAIASTLAPLDFVFALWQGGSEAHGYTDEWSDLDLRALVADDRVDDTFAALEAGLIQRYSMRLRIGYQNPPGMAILSASISLPKRVRFWRSISPSCSVSIPIVTWESSGMVRR